MGDGLGLTERKSLVPIQVVMENQSVQGHGSIIFLLNGAITLDIHSPFAEVDSVGQTKNEGGQYTWP